ncbi:MAG: hypothetical protein EOO54_14125 [Haliea sp.]|nr:MAG: hypothetical protein EOO54_14125 [Haliea sp.]
MKVTNQTSDQPQVKICLYKPEDKVDWIPVGAGVFVVQQNATVPWTPPSGEEIPAYYLKSFHPAFFDQNLANAQVGLNDSVAVRGGNGSYTIVPL